MILGVLLLHNIWSFPERCMGTSLRTKTFWTMLNSCCALFPHLEPRLFSGVTGSITQLVMEDGRHTKRLSERFGCQIIALCHHILEFVFPVYHLFHSYQLPWLTFFRIQSHIGVMFSICQQSVAWAAEIAGNQIQECWAICNMQVPRNGSISNSLRDTFWGKLKPCILSKHARSHLKRYYSTARHYSTLSRSRSCV